MNTTASTRNTRIPSLVLAAGMALVGWYLLQRTLGLSPGVFADEWYYSKMARLMPLSEATLPSWAETYPLTAIFMIMDGGSQASLVTESGAATSGTAFPGNGRK